MSSNGGIRVSDEAPSAGVLLTYAQGLVPLVLEKAREVRGFQARWKIIISKIEQVPSLLSQLATHPYFSKNALCAEELHSVAKTLNEAMDLAMKCLEERYEGKLKMQSELDSLSGKLDLNLHDCSLFIRSGLLGESLLPPVQSASESPSDVFIRALLARLQIGDMEAKQKALDSLVEIIREDESVVLSVLGQSNVTAFVQLLAATSPAQIREKAVGIVCSLVESGSGENWLVSEEVLHLIVKLVESGSSVAKERAVVYLCRVSLSRKISQLIVGVGGVKTLIETCRAGDSTLQSAAACTLKNLSAVPENQRALAEEGTAKAMINLLNHSNSLASKEHASECLEHLAGSNEIIRRSIVSQGGIQSLLAYLDSPSPHESGVFALKNLIGAVSFDALVSMNFLPRLIHVLRSGSPVAQRGAASLVCMICSCVNVKRVLGRAGCVPFLVKMLESKSDGVAEISAQALSIMATTTQNCKEIKREDRSVPNLVQLLDANPQNSAKKYAVSCLSSLSSSKKCRKLMISHGAIGYLKKLTEMNVPGAEKLQARLEKTGTKGIFGRK